MRGDDVPCSFLSAQFSLFIGKESGPFSALPRTTERQSMNIE
jgi:hypothetical protein